MGLAKFAKRPRENCDDYTVPYDDVNEKESEREKERERKREKKKEKKKGKEMGKKYSIKRNEGLANIYLWIGRVLREKRKEPCENDPSRMALVAAQKRGKFS